MTRINEACLEVHCAALTEVMHAEPALVREYMGPVMDHTDAVCCSVEELAKFPREL